MIPKRDAVAEPAPPKEFDQELVDMASYIHNYKVDSDLAVSTIESKQHYKRVIQLIHN